MKFKDFLNENGTYRDEKTIASYEKKVKERLDRIAGDPKKERAYGKTIFKEIRTKYSNGYSYLYDRIFSKTLQLMHDVNAWNALEGGREYYESLTDLNNGAEYFDHYLKTMDRSETSVTKKSDAKEIYNNTMERIFDRNDKFGGINTYIPVSKVGDLKFSGKTSQTTKVKESVKVTASKLYNNHNTDMFARVPTFSSNIEIIADSRGVIQHVVYEDKGVTKIISYDALSALEQALEKGVITEI